MHKKGELYNISSMVEAIQNGYTKQIDQQKLKRLSPMSMIEQWNGKKDPSFYIVDGEGEVSICIFCNGEEDWDWILEELKWDVIKDGFGEVQLVIKTSDKEIKMSFHDNLVEDIYSIAKIALQPSITIYYLMNSQGNVHYLGYNDVVMEKNLREKLLSD